MNCIVTAGPTFEPLDEVRRLINFSTGRLGSELVNYLADRGHTVTLLIGQQATWRGERRAHRVRTFGTTADLRARMRELAREPMDAVFHAAAVSDFTFGKVWQRTAEGGLGEIHAGKISSRFEKLLVELVPTAKIIAELRGWFPTACLVGWKYEVEGDRASVIEKAGRQISDHHTTACVANGPAYGAGFGLVTGIGQCTFLESAEALFATLENLARPS